MIRYSYLLKSFIEVEIPKQKTVDQIFSESDLKKIQNGDKELKQLYDKINDFFKFKTKDF